MKRMALVLALGLLISSFAGCENTPPETKDRLTPETMREMVEGPISEVSDHGLGSGERAFERLFDAYVDRYGAGSVQVADLLTAFGVGLYSQGYQDENGTESEASLKYLREAILHYRKAFGPKHPEVAVALHSLADAEIPRRVTSLLRRKQHSKKRCKSDEPRWGRTTGKRSRQRGGLSAQAGSTAVQIP